MHGLDQRPNAGYHSACAMERKRDVKRAKLLQYAERVAEYHRRFHDERG